LWGVRVFDLVGVWVSDLTEVRVSGLVGVRFADLVGGPGCRTSSEVTKSDGPSNTSPRVTPILRAERKPNCVALHWQW
jgi:hypothetical protein